MLLLLKMHQFARRSTCCLKAETLARQQIYCRAADVSGTIIQCDISSLQRYCESMRMKLT